MIKNVLLKDAHGITWIDIEAPTVSDLEIVAESYGLHKTAVADCLQPTHLPKFEQFDKTTFLIARSYDVSNLKDGETVQELTNKIALFVGPDFLITIHRSPQAYLTSLKASWELKAQKKVNVAHILNDVLNGVLGTFAVPLDHCDERLSKLEKAAFASRGKFPFRDGYGLLRKTSVMKRMLWMNLDVIRHLPQIPDQSRTFFQDLNEEGQRQLVLIDELVDSVRSVINLAVAMAGQRTNEASLKTNEVMRILTLFSLMFLPLNFVAGVFGMNFDRLPWLKEDWGFSASIAVMATLVVVILAGFRFKGWLKNSDI